MSAMVHNLLAGSDVGPGATVGHLCLLHAATLGEDSGTLEDVVEPYLLQIGFLARTSRGRVATELAYRHLGITPPDPGPQQTRLL